MPDDSVEVQAAVDDIERKLDSPHAPEGDDGLPDDPKVLKQRLKDTQKAFHTTRTELSKTKSELDKLSGKVEALAEKPTPAEVKDWLDDITDEELSAAPAKAKDLLKRFRGEIGEVLRSRDQWALDEAKKLIQAEMAKKAKLGEVDEAALEALRTDPDYEGFTDEQLAVVARKQQPKGNRLPPTIGGRRAVEAEPENDITKNPLFRQMYGDLMEEKK